MTAHRSYLFQTLVIYAVAFVYAYWMVVRPVAVAVNPAVSVANPNTFFFLFGGAAITAIILVKNVKPEHFWNLFFAVLAGAGIISTLFYSIVGKVSLNSAYVLSVAMAIGLLVWRRKSQTILPHNVVVLIACIGIARLLGAQFVPGSMLFVAVLVSAYHIIAIYFSQHMFAGARALFEKQRLFSIVFSADPNASHTVLSASDIIFPLGIAVSYLIYGSPLLFFATSMATAVGVVIAHAVRLQMASVPALPILIGCNIAAVYSVTYFL